MPGVRKPAVVAAAIAVLGCLAVAMVGLPGVNRPADASTASITATAAGPTATSPSPPTSTPRPTPTAAPTRVPGVIFQGSVGQATWSPSRNEVAVGAYEAPDWYTYVLDLDGHQLDKIRSDYLTWMDGDAYVAMRRGQGPQPDVLFSGHVGSADREQLPSGTLAAVGAGERIALTLFEDYADPGAKFIIRTAAGWSRPLPGVPMVFSPDGSLLAVEREPPNAAALSAAGNYTPIATALDVIDSGTGKVVARAAGALWPKQFQAAFSPDGRFVAFCKKSAARPPVGVLGLMEIATGHTWAIETQPAAVDWSDASHLRIRVYGAVPAAPRGLPVDVRMEPQPATGASATSRQGWVATWGLPDWNRLLIDKNGAQVTIDFPRQPRSASWSPDGTQLMVTWGFPADPGRGTAGFVSILRP
jgi:hypothetical protein